MTIQKVTPAVSGISNEDFREIETNSELHSIPFGALAVLEFYEGAAIREVVADYFSPDHADQATKYDDEKVDRDSTALWDLYYKVIPRGSLKRLDREDEYSFPVRVRILLVYPLQEIWEAEVEIPASRFGEVFSIAHDMYCHVYDLDDSAWRSGGHQDKAPRASEKSLNRAKGEHVWGHDMDDLVFEGLAFTPNPDWPTEQRKKMRFVDLTKGDTYESAMNKPAEYATVLEPIDKDKHSTESPFIGTVTFRIGS